jgi:hydrogenase/urease accessory protein HupE
LSVPAVAITVGALAIAFAGCRHPFLAVSVATICALSVYMIGLRNDLLMRGSLPALAVMAILGGRSHGIAAPCRSSSCCHGAR